MKETLIDMILQFFGKRKDEDALPASLLELLTKLKTLQQDAESEEAELEQRLQKTKFITVRDPSEKSRRFYTLDEQRHLGLEGCQLLNFLESNQIIDFLDREQIIQIAMETEEPNIDLTSLKHIVLLVISEHSPSRLYIEWLRYLFFSRSTSVLH